MNENYIYIFFFNNLEMLCEKKIKFTEPKIFFFTNGVGWCFSIDNLELPTFIRRVGT